MSVVRHSRRFYPYMYKWTRDVDALLPDHYKKRCREFMEKDPAPVHYRPNPNQYTVRESTGERIPVQNVPVDVKFPRQCNKGLWGGEGFVVGYIKKSTRSQRLPRVWRPFLHKRVLYSEILDRYMAVTVTLRTMDLIDSHYGLDTYILKTHEVDLCSKLGMDLKREMLVTLAKQSCYPDDPVRQQEILDKYKEFVIPLEEAEWIGLSVEEAVRKVQQQQEANPPRPLKDVFMEELAQQFSETSVAESSSGSFLGNLNPFSSKPAEQSDRTS
ncbi:large ribosomal subunit protein bL28m-like [Babylonia areolata]|uniref:large ribosomal subunit protein bL28m-like n=1 Tax=Babylonia areolata TaxID=304850 RepID=UPI003FD0003B